MYKSCYKCCYKSCEKTGARDVELGARYFESVLRYSKESDSG